MVFVVLVLMAADAATFWLAVPTVGISAEWNPVMAQGYASYGIGVVLLLKALAAFVMVALASRVERPRMRAFAWAVAAAIPLVGVAGNLSSWAAAARVQ